MQFQVRGKINTAAEVAKEVIKKWEEVDKVEKDVKVRVRQRSVGGGHIYVGGKWT